MQDQWVDETGVPATRRQMMVALQNVQQWLVMLGTQSGLVREARLLRTTGLTFSLSLLYMCLTVLPCDTMLLP